MDQYLEAARSSLKLAEQALRARLVKIEARPVGNILRRNQATHTIALIALVEELREIAAHDPLTWWENEEVVPF